MLVLTIDLKKGPIHCVDTSTGEHVEIQLLGVSNSQARLGFTASDNVEIDRDVIYQKKMEEKGNDKD